MLRCAVQRSLYSVYSLQCCCQPWIDLSVEDDCWCGSWCKRRCRAWEQQARHFTGGSDWRYVDGLLRTAPLRNYRGQMGRFEIVECCVSVDGKGRRSEKNPTSGTVK